MTLDPSANFHLSMAEQTELRPLFCINQSYLSECFSYYILRCCYFYSYFISTKKNWGGGPWKFFWSEMLGLKGSKDFSCLRWNDTGYSWSFIRDFPKIAKIFAEEKFQQNQSWGLISYVECNSSNHDHINVSISKKLCYPLLAVIVNYHHYYLWYLTITVNYHR